MLTTIIKSVRELYIDREKTLEIETLSIFSIERDLFFLSTILDRTRSRTTIVSLIEYPSIVRRAVIKRASTLKAGTIRAIIIYIPATIRTSCKRVTIVIIQNEKCCVCLLEPRNTQVIYRAINIIDRIRLKYAVFLT